VLLSLIALGSYVAFYAIISLQLIALFFTYEVAIGTLIYRRLRGPPLPERRWSLGRWGLIINIFAFVYGLLAIAFIVLPSTPTVTADDMNWYALLVQHRKASLTISQGPCHVRWRNAVLTYLLLCWWPQDLPWPGEAR